MLDVADLRYLGVLVSYVLTPLDAPVKHIWKVMENQIKIKQRILRGWCSWQVLPWFGNLWNQICAGYDVDLLGPLTSFDLRAVDRSVFCHLLPRPAPPAPQSLSNNLRCNCSPSRRRAQGWVSYFFCPEWWACIYRLTHLCIVRLACSWLLLLASSSLPLQLYVWPPHHNQTSSGCNGLGRSTIWQVGVRLAHLIHHHRPHRPHSAWDWNIVFIF